jgi:hypothetical protein
MVDNNNNNDNNNVFVVYFVTWINHNQYQCIYFPKASNSGDGQSRVNSIAEEIFCLMT